MTTFGTTFGSPKTFVFWRNLFLYYYFFAILGHFLELAWAGIGALLFNMPPFQPVMVGYSPLAQPYGLGVLALILGGIPLLNYIERRLTKPKAVVMKRVKKKHESTAAQVWLMLIAFLTSCVLLAAVEAVCGYVLLAAFGDNPFWDYSGRPLAILHGTVWVPNMLFFGVLGTVVMVFVLPRVNRLLARIPGRVLNIVFWVLASTYAVDLIHGLLTFRS